ncbi:response regulator [Terriglobus albidus]|uniref:response regulator n=1 Tax=Terriglobus albidus TaxID=1592106 RepID=UPI0021E09104|nr:response regulator transcription factor [Terriglobus albidus]
MDNLRILIADDHELIRRGVRNLLAAREGWSVIAEASNGLEAAEKIEQLQPDIAIVDFSMPLLDGSAVASRSVQSSPKTSVIVLTMHDSERIAYQVLQSGAKGFVLKSDADHNLIEAVNAVSRSEHFFTKTATNLLMRGILNKNGTEKASAKTEPSLSAREEQVLCLLAEGTTSKEAAARLGISVRTVESHRIRINRKLGLDSIADLVRYAIRNGYASSH